MVEYIPPRARAEPNGVVNGVAPTDGLIGAANGSATSHLMGKTVLIDNYDSFTYNVVEYLSDIGADLVVYRNDKVTLEELIALQPERLVISPGPGHPLQDSGISIPAIQHFAGKIPILGVCMGLQCIYAAYTGIIEFAGEILHGKTSDIEHDARGLYAGLPAAGVVGTRYHSLAARIDSLPRELVVTSKSASGVVMGIRHTRYAVEAIQYHPESILSKGGKEMFANFLGWTGGMWSDNPQSLIDAQAVEQAEATKAPVIAMNPAAEQRAAERSSNVASGSGTNGTTTPASQSVGTILERIHVQRLKDIEASKAVPGFSPEDLDTALMMNLAPPQIDFRARLTKHAHLGLPGVMAEMKRASPSKGNIDVNAHAGAQALAYARGGASVISVLTEPKWFKGTLNDLTLARRAVDGMPDRPAILRKDFIVDEYQIKEARLAGADTVLLIVAMLDDTQLRDLYNYSASLGMEPLVEVNNAAEMKRALSIGAKVVGVNNRNLHDFNVDMGTTSRLAEAAKAGGVVLAALSGITGRADVEKYMQEGVGAVLVGEALMRAADKRAFIHDLLGVDSDLADGAVAAAAQAPLVKICGLQTVEAALTAALAGADMLGMILAPGTKRTVSLSQAAEMINVVRSLRGGADAMRTEIATVEASKAKASESAGADAAASFGSAGEDWFTFHAKRLRAAPYKPLFVGVFRDQLLEEIVQVTRTLKLDVVQLHGRTEHIDWAKFLPGVFVTRVFHVPIMGPSQPPPLEGPGQGPLADASRESCHHIIALDTASAAKGQEGGSGQTFDWSIARRLSRFDAVTTRVSGVRPRQLPLMLAGGLHASNVAEAAQAFTGADLPLVLDTSSGVETDGKKDMLKIQAFVAAVKGLGATRDDQLAANLANSSTVREVAQSAAS